MADKFESGMMGSGQVAWHGKGNVISGLATREEAIVLAGQDWQVVKVNAQLNGKDVPGCFLTVRMDTQAVLGMVGPHYNPIQNSELYDFLDPVIDAKEAVYETAGVLCGGKKVWIMAKLPSEYVIAKDDLVQQFLLVATSHDGSLAYTITWTDIRVVCANTLGMALNMAERGGNGVYHVKHTHDYGSYIKMAHNVMGLASKNTGIASSLFSELAAHKMNGALVNEFIRHMIPASQKEEATGKVHELISQKREIILNNFDDDMNNPEGAEGSGWTAYNAVTQWIDYSKPARAKTDRLNWSWFGDGQRYRAKALKWLAGNLLNRKFD